jgi:hypothetical protein
VLMYSLPHKAAPSARAGPWGLTGSPWARRFRPLSCPRSGCRRALAGVGSALLQLRRAALLRESRRLPAPRGGSERRRLPGHRDCRLRGRRVGPRRVGRVQARINSALVIGSTINRANVLPHGIAPDYDRARLLEFRHPVRVALAARLEDVKRAALRMTDRRQPVLPNGPSSTSTAGRSCLPAGNR